MADGVAEGLPVERQPGTFLTGLEPQVDRLSGSRISSTHRISGAQPAAEGGDQMRRRGGIENVDVDSLADERQERRERASYEAGSALSAKRPDLLPLTADLLLLPLH